jgi:hypothetical protein
VRGRDALRDVETQTKPTTIVLSDLPESLEDRLELVGRDADAAIPYRESRLTCDPFRRG